jgi:hypothetical protein
MPTEQELEDYRRREAEAQEVCEKYPDDHDWTEAYNELDVCSKCKCYEGGTTTQCPGKSVPYDLSQAVYQGRVDFRGGKWTNQPSARGMPHAYGAKREPYVELDDVMEYIR